MNVQLPSLIEQHRIAERCLVAAEPFSSDEYFSVLLDRACRARSAGNYGIAAAAVCRSSGLELVCIGVNTLFTDSDPQGHAELNALRTLREALLGIRSSRLPALRWRDASDILNGESNAFIRSCPTNKDQLILFATLEPCPMCTVATLNAGVAEVVVALPDPDAGALASTRIHSLGSIWNTIADTRLTVDFIAQGSNQMVSPKPSAELRSSLELVFSSDRAILDERLRTEGVLPLGNASSVLMSAYATPTESSHTLNGTSSNGVNVF